MSESSSPAPLWSGLKKNKPAVISLLVIAAFILAAVGADGIAWLLNIDPQGQDILNRYGPPSAEHWLGTDEAGRDVFIRLIFGARVSLGVAITVAIAATLLGVAVGTIAGYFGGKLDNALMRFTDALLALPTIPILIILAAVDPAKIPLLNQVGSDHVSVVKMILVLMMFSWMTQARLVRGEVLSVKELDFVLAARAAGMRHGMIMIKEIVPNVLSPVIVSVTLTVGSSILYEASLSFLGLGIQPPTASWGNMLNNAQEILSSVPLLAVLPGLLILIVVISFNFLGDGLQEALDPRALRR